MFMRCRQLVPGGLDGMRAADGLEVLSAKGIGKVFVSPRLRVYLGAVSNSALRSKKDPRIYVPEVFF